jgi:alkylation response protein AidB-like acyl-CoA dehydrogenase
MQQATASTKVRVASEDDEALPGGGFLVAPVPGAGTFTREKVTDEQRAFAEAADRFIQNEVWTKIEGIEHRHEVEGAKGKEPLVVALTRQAAELGLCSIEIPSEHGGLGLDLTTAMHVSETLRGCASFAATLGAHSGIGTLPIVYFGNAAQKAQWLPKLATTELFSCYCLTEPGNGSDALGGKTTAVLSADKTHYVLNGQKQFITNGGWADVGVVFAGIDGKYSGLIVDLRSPGVVRGAEEKKMGIKGSSTTGLIFQDVKVPAENLLGQVGDAAAIALNILYAGRMKLGFATMGTAKYAIDLTVKFAKERRQFGRPVIGFDLQQAKLAEMTAWTYASDAVCYRVVGAVDRDLSRLPDPHDPQGQIEVLRRYGLECALIKIHGSETLSRVLYHALRMHGGYGFCEEYQVERLARDNVVETIYEGTNDINRLVLSGALAESVHGSAIPFRDLLDDVHRGLRAGDLDPGPTCASDPDAWLGAEAQRVFGLKRALAYAVEQALIGVGQDVRVEQQVMCALADGLIALAAAEGALAKTLACGATDPQARARVDVTHLCLLEATDDVRRRAHEALSHAVAPAARAEKLEVFDRLLRWAEPPVDSDAADGVALKRRIGQHVAARGRYPF